MSSCTDPSRLTERIKSFACKELGLDAIGIAPCDEVAEAAWKEFEATISGKGYEGLGYLHKYKDLRRAPQGLLPSGQSIIVVAQNYFPPQRQPDTAPQVSYYAYGRDYHKVVRKKLERLQQFITQAISPESQGRICCDSTPILERYWISRAGIARQGKSGLMILPGRGTFFIFGALITSLVLDYDTPLAGDPCGSCQRCVQHCPGGALSETGRFRADRCLSYLTIEHKGPFSTNQARRIGNHFFGCDDCQLVCPHNRGARPHTEPDFALRPSLASLTYDQLRHFDQTLYDTLTIGSSIRRCDYASLERNARTVLAHLDSLYNTIK